MNNKYLILVNRENSMKNEWEYKKVLCESIYANDRTLEEKTYWIYVKFLDTFFYTF